MTVSDDSLLRRLAALDSDDGLTDEDRRALERLCAGQLPQAEREALIQRADDHARNGDRRLLDAVKMYEPLSAGARARIAEAVHKKARGPAPVVASRGTRRRGFLLWLVPTFAAGAAAVALWSRPGADAGLPPYSVEVAGGMKAERGPADQTLGRLAPGAPLRLTLRPHTRVAGVVGVRTFVEAGGQWTALPIAWNRDDSGAFRVEGTVSSLLGPINGAVRVHLVVGREERLQREGELLAKGGGADAGSGWQRLTVPLDIGSPGR